MTGPQRQQAATNSLESKDLPVWSSLLHLRLQMAKATLALALCLALACSCPSALA